MKIVLCHVGGANLGDAVILRCVKMMVGEILSGVGKVELVDVEIGKSHPLSEPERELCGWRAWVLDRLRRHHKKLCAILVWYWSRERADFLRRECRKLRGADAVVFVGGGVVKFRHQHLYPYVWEIVTRCRLSRTPVLFNSVGVEGYAREDSRCRFLRDALNSPCVRMMTTRDDAETLNRDYRTKAKWTAVRVADPAMWTPEAFGISKSAERSLVVGLNVIRPEIFKDYLYEVDAGSLTALYVELVRRLLAEGHPVELFSNGGMRDGEFIDRVMDGLGELRRDPRLTAFRPGTAEELVRRIAVYDRLLAVRLHAAIIGTSLGVPNVSLVWNRKQLLFGEAIGLSENFLTKDDFVAETVFVRLMAAKGYVGDAAYKDSVLSTLRAGLSSCPAFCPPCS